MESVPHSARREREIKGGCADQRPREGNDGMRLQVGRGVFRAVGVEEGLSDQLLRLYRRALLELNHSGIPYLVGGTYALVCVTGLEHRTKDLDLFVRPQDCRALLNVLATAGFATERTYPHWLAKAWGGGARIDIIYNSGNGECAVDDAWLQYSLPGELFEVAVQLCPIEEMIWSKSYVMERERYDGADVAHLLRAFAPVLDWRRLLFRFNAHWRVLLSHLLLFGFIYPTESARVPPWVMRELLRRLDHDLADEQRSLRQRVCRGGLLSRAQYLSDFREWNYTDARLHPFGRLSAADIAHWTQHILRD